MKTEFMISRIGILALISCLLLAAAIPIGAQQAGSFVQDNIKKARERLGDKLLTTADAVVARHVEAIGGREAVRLVKTMMIRGRNARFGKGDNPLILFLKQPHFIRQMESPESTSYVLGDGEKVWLVTPTERRKNNAWWAKSTLHTRIDGNFLDYKERGIGYELIGIEGFETEPFVYYHLRRTFTDGEIEDLYFDVATGPSVHRRGGQNQRRLWQGFLHRI